MELILLEKVRNLGDIGDKIKVKAGFGRNYLLPQGKATPATEENITKFEKIRADLEKKAAESLAVAQSRADALAKLTITIPAQASEEGRLFGSVNVREVVAAIKNAGEQVDKKEISLPEGPIHDLGEHEVTLQLHTDVNVTIKVNVVPEE